MAKKSKIDSAEPKSGAVKVFTYVENPVYREARKVQFFQEEFTRIAKLSNNEHLNVQTRVSKLQELAKAYKERKLSERFKKFNIDNVGLLERQATAAAEQLIAIEKAKMLGSKTDTGKGENQI